MQYKIEPTLLCSKCKKHLPLKSFPFKSGRYPNRLGRAYVCKKCTALYAKNYYHSTKNTAIRQFWEFHNHQDLYSELEIPGFGGFPSFSPVLQPATFYFFCPIHLKVAPKYLLAFQKLYGYTHYLRAGVRAELPEHPQKIKNIIEWGLFSLNELYPGQNPYFNIFLQCANCHLWRRTYKENPFEAISTQSKLTPLNFKRNYQTKTGWALVCNVCATLTGER